MPMTVRAKAPDLRKLSRDLKEAGFKDLRRELYSGLNRSTKGLRGAVKANALAVLPAEGGLNQRVAAANIRVNGSGGRVKIIARPSKRGGQFDPAGLDDGTNKHPTYGHKPIVSQAVTPGWFSEPIRDGLGGVEAELLAAIEVVAAKCAGDKVTLASARRKILAGENLTAEERRVFLGSNLGSE